MLRFLLPAVALIFASAAQAASTETKTAIFAGGCFWCVEADFDKLPGVVSTTSGYTGGHLKNPTYRDVTSETSGHLEAVEVRYDPAKVGYQALVDYFFRHIDPTDAGGQFCDRGESYTTAIFVASDEERAAAEAAKQAAASKLKKPIVTPVRERTIFYPAEDYHQNYYKKSPARYQYYRSACGRDARVRSLWGR
jgi:peptide-methionine (S)-S-oxide reductase